MMFRRSAVIKYFLAAVFGGVLYAEWIVFLIQPLFWKSLDCDKNDHTCTKILFVADPQIQGDSAVPPPINTIFNFDSDRFLRSTFSVVTKHFKPDVLVYMGDIMDEGSIANLRLFYEYVKRISNIFDLNYTVTTVWIPGDNDIGGEHPEPVNRQRLKEFEKVFGLSTSITRVPGRNITFFKVNTITHEYTQNPETGFPIVISHYPVTSNHVFASGVHNKIKPQVYFCAHDHVSKYMRSLKTDLTNKVTFQLSDNRIIDLLIDNYIYEVYVPTCSYRMGTSNIGYGAAILGRNNTEMRYTVFWSPTRFPYLLMYLIFGVILSIYCIVFSVAKLLIITKNSHKDYTKLPLSEGL